MIANKIKNNTYSLIISLKILSQSLHYLVTGTQSLIINMVIRRY